MSNEKKLHSRLENLFTGLGSRADGAPAPAAPVAPNVPAAAHLPLARRDPLATTPGWAWETDAHGVLTTCSSGVTDQLGLPASDLIGQPLTALLHPGDHTAREELAAAFDEQRPILDQRLTARRSDGGRAVIVISALPRLDEGDQFAGYRGIAQVAGTAAAISANGPSVNAQPAHPITATTERFDEADAPPASPLPTSEPHASEPHASAPNGLNDQPGQAPLPPAAHAPVPVPVERRQPPATPPALQPAPERNGSLGYLAGPDGLTPIADFAAPEMDEAATSGKLVRRSAGGQDGDAGRALALPIRVQDQTIGVLNFFDDDQARDWSEDDVALVQAVTDQLALALENARLFNETREYLVKQTLLYDVTRAAASAPDLAQALDAAAAALGRVLPDADIAIMLLDESGRNLRIQASVGFPADLRERLTIPVGQGVTGWVAQHNQALLIPDVRRDPRYVAGVGGMVSEAAVPLAMGERVIGVLNVESPGAGAFDEQDLQLLSTLAGTLSAIIVNNNLLAAISQERERLGVLYDVLQALITRPGRRAILDTALNMAARIGASHAYVLLVGDREVEAEFHTTLPGLDNMTPREAREFAATLTRSGLEHWVLANRQAAVVTDTLADERWHIAPAHTDDEPARAVISVPLQTQRGALTGVLAYTHTQPGMLGLEQLPLVESIAGQVAVALENDLLRLQQQAQSHNSETLARAAQALTRTLIESELHDIVANQLFEAYRPNAVAVLRWDAIGNSFNLLAERLAEGEDPVGLEAWPRRGETMPATRRADLLQVIHERQGHIRRLREAPGDQLRESLALPLMYGGEVDGVVEIVHTGGAQGLSRADMELFQAILTAAASALQSARLYELQRQTAERLAEVDRLKSQFLANMSHELRTPLNSIIGFSRVILKGIDGPLTDLQTQDLTSINSAGQHLLGLINDILDMARIEAGKMELVLDEMDLHETIHGVLSTAVALVKDRGVELREDIEADLPMVRADTMRIRQVLLNLLSNAAKFTERGSITLQARSVQGVGPHSGRLEPFVEISVIDTGPGIAPDDMAKLFEPFSQVDASATRKAGGTGLGLSICRQLVELHNGRIWVESEVGQGSAFRFIVPTTQAMRGELVVPDTAPLARIVLAVDDDSGVIGLYRRYLQPHGYYVIGVTRSSEAVTRAAELRPVAILLDVVMPNKDGWQVLTELKRSEVTLDIPVIMCTLVNDPDRAYDLGAANYLSKPILEEDLVQAVRNLPAPGHGLRPAVLVITSRSDDVEFVRRALRSGEADGSPGGGFRMIEAHGSQAGLTAARNQQPAAIVLDLAQPDADGFQVLAALRSDPLTRNIPVVILADSELNQEERSRLTRQVTALRRKGAFQGADLVQDLRRAIATARA